MLAGHQRTAARTAGWAGDVGLREVNTLGCQLVDVRRLEDLRVAVAEIGPSQVVHEEQYDIRFCGMRGGGEQSNGGKCA